MTQNNQPTSVIEIDGKDLPAYCPNPNMPVWSSHPRVFIALDEDQPTKCPYCGTFYKIKPGTAIKGH